MPFSFAVTLLQCYAFAPIRLHLFFVVYARCLVYLVMQHLEGAYTLLAG